MGFFYYYMFVMDHQNQNINPDYGFILDKPGPVEKKPKFSKKLTIGGIAILVGMLVLFIGSALVPKNYSNQAAQTSMAYFSYINQKDYDAAYGLLQAGATDNKASFTQRIGPVMQGSYNLAKCVSKGTTKQGHTYQTTIACPFASTGVPQVFVVQTERQGNAMVITKFTVPELKASS